MFVFKNLVVDVVCILAIWPIFVSSKSIWFEKCRSRGEDKICEIGDVTMDPCEDHSNPQECLLKRGVNSTFKIIDFVPFFNADVFYKHIYEVQFDSSGSEIELKDNVNHHEDACSLVSCPIKAGQKYTLTYSHLIEQKFQPGNFLVKWRIGNGNDDCCIKIRVQIL